MMKCPLLSVMKYYFFESSLTKYAFSSRCFLVVENFIITDAFQNKNY